MRSLDTRIQHLQDDDMIEMDAENGIVKILG
jgi:hypothetical protein